MFNVYDNMRELIPVATDLKHRENGDFLIVAAEDGSIHYLNEVAKEFYLLLDNDLKITEIVDRLLQEYDVDKKALETDMVELIRDLQWKKLIRLKELK